MFDAMSNGPFRAYYNGDLRFSTTDSGAQLIPLPTAIL